MSAEEIHILQESLDQLGFKTSLTGILDEGTRKSLDQLQQYYGLSRTGEPTEETMKKIEEILSGPLVPGRNNSAVSQLKESLNYLGFNVSMNFPGSYGAATREAVQELQEYYGLVVNGIADEVTLKKIDDIKSAPLSLGLKRSDVLDLKLKLGEVGFIVSASPTNYYGPVTEGVVKDFQSSFNLNVTGIADQQTLEKLDGIVSNPLRLHQNNEQVIQFKENLNTLGFSVSMNFPGNYGPATERATRNFQSYYGIANTGIGDAETLAVMADILASPYKLGANNEEVRLLKENLNMLGFTVSMNFPNSFGPATETTLKTFQRTNNLVPNGIGDPVTMAKVETLINEPMGPGLRRKDVINFKLNLEEVGFKVSANPTDLYGPVTEQVVRDFQSYYGLKVSGIADKETLSTLKDLQNAPLRKGGNNHETVLLKDNLNFLGFDVSMNSPRNFGPATELAVKKLQKYYGLVENGIGDPVTLAKIEEVLNAPFALGLKRHDVVSLKLDLEDIGFFVASNPTDYYGSVTERVVREFQSYYGLKETGVADKETLVTIENILNSSYREGESHNGVVDLKEKLNILGFHVTMNSPESYGSLTAAAVKELQEYYGLRMNGIGDQVTLDKIEKLIQSPLSKGQVSDEVVTLKEDLNKLGFEVSMNFPREYGSATERAVREFQVYYNLKVSGIAETKTLEKIENILKGPLRLGQSNNQVRQLKEDLNSLGFTVGMNFPNSYGAETEKAVREFQEFFDLRVSGIADQVTLQKIDELQNLAQMTTYTQYNLTLEQALNEQLRKDVPPQTDLYRNSPAYLSAKSVTPIKGTTSGNVNLRSEATTNSSAHTLALRGTDLTLKGEVEGQSVGGNILWYEIDYDGLTLFVHSSLVNVTQVKTLTPVSIQQSPEGGAHSYRDLVKGVTLNVREKLNDNNWYDINYEGNFGIWRNARTEDVLKHLDPEQNDILQHLVLDRSTGLSVSQVNLALNGKGVLDGMGQAFLDAGRLHEVNELYLLSHALLESGHGTSSLARGIEVGKNQDGNPEVVNDNNRSKLTEIKTTYNMFGIGAFDHDAHRLGAIRAYERSWFSPEEAIIGGAEFVRHGYFDNGQNTLYKMRWNHLYLNSWRGYSQYATDMGWAVKQLPLMRSLYNQMDNPIMLFDIVKFN
nr:peptidoglycan-binding protein [Alteribacter salitolerans]